MERYSYQGIQQAKILFSKASGALGILLFTAFTLVLLSGVSLVREGGNPSTIFNDPGVTLLCLAFWFLLVAWSVGLTLINFLPTVWTTEEGLQISAFIFFRIRILWSDIIDIGVGKPPRGYILVRARQITPFHRIYGWLYSRTIYPSFLIGEGIKDRDILIMEIKQRIRRSV